MLAGDVRGNAYILLYHAWIKENRSDLESAKKPLKFEH